jgi:hypothetical protein
MKYQISAEQRNFFENHGYIEYERLLSEKECSALLSAVKKCEKPRDMARESEEVRKLLSSPRFGQIASALCLKKKLRYGLDELYSPAKRAPGFSVLQDERCIQGITFAMLICLDEDAIGEPEDGDIFPRHTGNVTFFTPDGIYDSKHDASHQYQTCILLVWVDSNSQYIFQEKDAYTHDLKKLGYVFGDTLLEKTHPLFWQ